MFDTARKAALSGLVLVSALGAGAAPQAKTASNAAQTSVSGLEKAQMHYDERVAGFREENAQPCNVVLLGDSITEGMDMKLFGDKKVLNRGISSDTIGIVPKEKDRRGVLNRLDCSVFDCATTHVFLMIGINDLGDNHSLDDMAQGYKKILETIRAKAPQVTVHVESLLPTGGKFAFHNEKVRQFNARLEKLAGQMGCPYMDVHAAFCDAKGELRAELTRDGLHPNAAGNQILAEQIKRAMGWQEQPR